MNSSYKVSLTLVRPKMSFMKISLSPFREVWESMGSYLRGKTIFFRMLDQDIIFDYFNFQMKGNKGRRLASLMV